MYIFKNAWKNIIRNKGRNILIGIIFIVIAASASISLAIRNSANSLINSYKESTDTTATITVNRDNMRQNMTPPSDSGEDSESNIEKISSEFKEASKISIDDIKNYADSKYVKSYYYSMSVGVDSDLTKAESSSGNEIGRGPHGMESSTDFTLTGYSSIDGMTNFINATYKITSGEVFSDFEGNYAIINSELATQNNLKVGDSITFTDPNNSENTVTLEITGIYEDNDSTQKMSMFTSSANTIITNTKVVEDFSSKDDDLKVNTNPTFVLTSEKVLDKFSSELTSKGLSEYLTVSSNLDQVESATSTILNVKGFATTFLIITLIIGAIVLFVINMINIRERKYEIGVLRTIGMKKSLLCLQFISEIIIVSVAALLIGAGIGAASSVPVANSLLQNEITSSEEKVNEISSNFGHGPGGDRESSNMKFNKMSGNPNVKKIDNINAVVNFKVLLELLGIGLVLTIISSASSMIAIQRFSPLTILKERS